MKGRWIRWSALGCGGVLLAFVVLFLITTLLTGLGYRRAAESRMILEERFDTQADFTPGDSIEPDRMERFLAVRRALQPRCPMVTRHLDLFARLGGAAPSEERTFLDVLRDGRPNTS